MYDYIRFLVLNPHIINSKRCGLLSHFWQKLVFISSQISITDQVNSQKNQSISHALHLPKACITTRIQHAKQLTNLRFGPQSVPYRFQHSHSPPHFQKTTASVRHIVAVSFLMGMGLVYSLTH